MDPSLLIQFISWSISILNHEWSSMISFLVYITLIYLLHMVIINRSTFIPVVSEVFFSSRNRIQKKVKNWRQMKKRPRPRGRCIPLDVVLRGRCRKMWKVNENHVGTPRNTDPTWSKYIYMMDFLLYMAFYKWICWWLKFFVCVCAWIVFDGIGSSE